MRNIDKYSMEGAFMQFMADTSSETVSEFAKKVSGTDKGNAFMLAVLALFYRWLTTDDETGEDARLKAQDGGAK